MRLFASVATIAGLSGAAFAITLNANPGPANNGLSTAGSGLFMDLTATNAVTMTGLTTASSAAAGVAFTFEVFIRSGSGLGGPVGSGPGSSSAGWTSLGIANGTQGAVANGISLLVDTPDFNINAGETVGVALVWRSGGGPRYFGTGAPPYENYSDANLALVTGDARSAAFTTTGSWFASRAMVGSWEYEAVPEPATMAILGLGAAALLRRRRK